MDEEVEEEQNQQHNAVPESNAPNAEQIQDGKIAQVQAEVEEDKKASEVLFENDEQAAGEKQQ